MLWFVPGAGSDVTLNVFLYKKPEQFSEVIAERFLEIIDVHEIVLRLWQTGPPCKYHLREHVLRDMRQSLLSLKNVLLVSPNVNVRYVWTMTCFSYENCSTTGSKSSNVTWFYPQAIDQLKRFTHINISRLQPYVHRRSKIWNSFPLYIQRFIELNYN